MDVINLKYSFNCLQQEILTNSFKSSWKKKPQLLKLSY